MSTFDDPVTVQVLPPSSPFSGVQVLNPDGVTRQIEFLIGSPVRSVFGRIGDVVAKCSDYESCYAPAGAGLPDGGSDGYVLTKNGDAPFEATWEPSPSGDYVLKQTSYPTPTTLNQVIQCLKDAGLCAP